MDATGFRKKPPKNKDQKSKNQYQTTMQICNEFWRLISHNMKQLS